MWLSKNENDILNAENIRSDSGFYFEEELASTNDKAKQLALLGCEEYFFVTCNRQSAGKGRLGRTWISPRNQNIYLSVVLKPQLKLENVPQITLVTGLAVARTIKETTGLDAKIKWPNDIIINGRKIAGILAEMQTDNGNLRFVVVGIGVNVNQYEFDEEIALKATSIFKETGKRCRRSDMISDIIYNIKAFYARFCDFGFADVKKQYINQCININKTVRAVYESMQITGVAVDISDKGELVLQTDNGIVCVSSGEASVRTENNLYI